MAFHVGSKRHKMLRDIERMLMEYFDGSTSKVSLWFRTYNPQLSMTPREMIDIGRINRMYVMVKAATEENKRDDK